MARPSPYPPEAYCFSVVEGALRVRGRVERSSASVRFLRQEITEWLDGRRGDPRFVRFVDHFDVLDVVLGRMLDAIEGALAEAGRSRSSGEAYERCRELDRSLVTTRRMFEWYASKYDQRLNDRLAPALRGADEVVRSCWQQPFAVREQTAPTGPLPYFDVRFDAHATPRVSVPPDLRAPTDAVIADLVGRLPIPTIALPVWAAREAWWLVLAAHETGHHVHKDLAPGLEAATRSALTAAVLAAVPDDEVVARDEVAALWAGWALEAFADAYSILMVGAAAGWAIDELEHASAVKLLAPPEPGGRYPPPAIRLALLGELARQTGAAGRLPGAGDTPDVPNVPDVPNMPDLPAGTRMAAERHLTVVPAVAAALLDVEVDGLTLRRLSGARPEWFAAQGRVDAWAQRLTKPEPVLSRLDERVAARLVIGAGVAAAEHATGDDRSRLHDNLVEILPACGQPGRMGASPPRPEIDALAADLAGRLLAGDGG